MKLHHNYYVYILCCADSSYYTGMTNDLERRLQEHTEGLLPLCYTFKRRPLELVYSEHYRQVNDAIAREKQIQRWSRKKKEALIKGDIDELKRLAKNRVGNSGFEEEAQ